LEKARKSIDHTIVLPGSSSDHDRCGRALYPQAAGGYNRTMPHVIHYEDDIFITDDLVRVIADASRLEPDSEVIGDTVLSAARLADATLRRVKDLVLQNDHLVERPEYIRLLSRTARSLADALSELLKPQSSLAPTVSSSSDELLRMAAAHRASASELRDILRESTGENTSLEDLVSGDELSELLKIQ